MTRKSQPQARFLTFIAAILLCWALPSPVLAQIEVLSPDLELLATPLSPDSIIPNKLIMVRTGLRNFTIEVLVSKSAVGESVANAARQRQAVAAINGSFFSPEHKPLGIVVHRGEVLNQLHFGGSLLTGVFQLTRRGASVVSRIDYDQRKSIEAVQAGPRLIQAATPITGFENRREQAARAGVCVDSAGRTGFFFVGGEFGGATFHELQSALLRAPFSCQHALAFDGGSSAQLIIRPPGRPELLYGTTTAVPIAVAFVAR